MNAHARSFLSIIALCILASGIIGYIPRLSHGTEQTILYFFWGVGCPHCKKEITFLKELARKYPTLEIKSYESKTDQRNARFYAAMARVHGVRVLGVPATFVDDRVWIGFNDDRARQIEEVVQHCIEEGCVDPTDPLRALTRQSQPAPEKTKAPETLTIPLIGSINLEKLSLPAFTILLGGVDGFNPCAFFVLFILLGMLIYARSRTRMLIVGGTFVFFSGVIYFLFMSAWLNLFLLLGTMRYVTIVAGLVALGIGVVNTKDFFFFKHGASLSIPETAKPKLFDRMRKLMKADSLISMMIGTIVLAIVANAYELLCTAGFPMVFTRMLTLHHLSVVKQYAYLVLYNVIYVIPLFVIVMIFVITLGRRKLKESEGRVLKFVSGLMMLSLGATLLIRPELLSNAIAAAALLAGVVLLTVTAVLLQKMLQRKQEIPKCSAG